MKKFDFCVSCPLFENPIVHGQIGVRKDIILIGEAPGYNEVLEGRPFVGRAGILLRQVLSELDINDNSLYISNAVLCRPTNEGRNRAPSVEEIKCCNKRLLDSIREVKPSIIISLGVIPFFALTAKDFIYPPKFAMMDIAGGTFEEEIGVICPTYHPAYILRNPDYRDVFKSDIKNALWETL